MDFQACRKRLNKLREMVERDDLTEADVEAVKLALCQEREKIDREEVRMRRRVQCVGQL